MAQSLHYLLLGDLPLVVFIAVAAGIGLALLLSAFLIAYKQPDPEKLSAYECGFNAFDDARMKFDVRFYLVSMIFIIFDIEIVFLYPWAVVFHQIETFGLIEVIVFAAVVFVSFVYLISNGALTWGPPKTLQPS